MDTKEKKYTYIGTLVLLTFFGAIYYYGIQRTFIPDGEALGSLKSAWESYQMGELPSFWNTILRTMCYIWIPFGGLSYKTIRMAYVSLYAINLFFCLDIVLRDARNRAKFICISIFILFMIFLPIEFNAAWGFLGNGWTQYPMNQHPEAMLCTVVGIWIFYRLIHAEKKQKKVFFILLILWNFFSIKMANQIWIIIFLVPEIMYFAIKVIQRKKADRKDIIPCLVSFCSLGYIFLKVLSLKCPALCSLFALKGEEALFFKSTEWSSLKDLPTNIGNYFTAILSMFGCNYTQLNVYNISIILYLFKIVLVVLIFLIIFSNLKLSENNEFEFFLSWGFALLSFFWIFSDYGQSLEHHLRYLMILLPYGTILLCININKMNKFFIGNSTHWKFAMLFLLCAFFPFGKWNSYTENIYDREYREIVDVISKKKLHSGVWGQSFALGENLYVLSNGKCNMQKMTFQKDGTVLNFSEDNKEIYDFLIIEDNGNIGEIISSGDVYNYLQANIPDEDIILCDGTVHMYLYYDGIHSSED